jgi:hypothetical protein
MVMVVMVFGYTVLPALFSLFRPSGVWAFSISLLYPPFYYKPSPPSPF